MKNIQKIKILAVTVLITVLASSCEKDFGDINKSWDAKVYNPTIPALYNSIASSMTAPDGAGNIYTSWVYQNSQLAAMTAATGFRMDNFSAAYWNKYYNALANSRKIEELIGTDANAANMNNIKAMTKVLVAYKTLTTTFIYGDMPYAEGGKAFIGGSDFFRPKYDSQAEIIKGAIAELKWAIDNLSTNASQATLGASETIFGNDVATWIKFANSLRLRYAVNISAKDAAYAASVITEALTKPLLSPSDNLGIYPAKTPNYLNDRGGWYRGNSYIRMGSTMFNAMSSNTNEDGSGIFDLRCKIFFEPNRAGKWVPYPQAPTATTAAEIGNAAPNDPYDESRLKDYNVTGNYLYSPLNFYYVVDKTLPMLLITGSEVSFLKAEIYNRGLGAGADAAKAKAFYEEGISESVKFWYKTANGSSIWTSNKPAAAPTASELENMLKAPQIAYASAPADALKQIYKQSWISLFHQPLEAWDLARRTNYATPSVPLNTTSPGYNVFKIIYPQSEIDGNNANWKAVVTSGTDSPSTKPWFMN
jgi:Starch-binding associating with outer membrane